MVIGTAADERIRNDKIGFIFGSTPDLRHLYIPTNECNGMFHFPLKYMPKRKLLPLTTSTIQEKTPPRHRLQTERNLGLETYFLGSGGCRTPTVGFFLPKSQFVRCIG